MEETSARNAQEQMEQEPDLADCRPQNKFMTAFPAGTIPFQGSMHLARVPAA